MRVSRFDEIFYHLVFHVVGQHAFDFVFVEGGIVRQARRRASVGARRVGGLVGAGIIRWFVGSGAIGGLVGAVVAVSAVVGRRRVVRLGRIAWRRCVGGHFNIVGQIRGIGHVKHVDDVVVGVDAHAYLGRVGVHHVSAVNLVLVGVALDEFVEALVGEGLRPHLDELHVVGRQCVLPVVGGQVSVFHEVVIHRVLVVPQLEVEEVDDVVGRVVGQREILRPAVPEEMSGDVDHVIPRIQRLPYVHVGELVAA